MQALKQCETDQQPQIRSEVLALEHKQRSLRQQYQMMRRLGDQEALAAITAAGIAVSTELALLRARLLPTLAEYASAEQVVADISLLLLDLSDSLNVSNNFSGKQIEQAAAMLYERYKGGLSLEHIAEMVEQAKLGTLGKIYDRLDIQVIHACMETYLNRKREKWHQEQVSAHHSAKPDPTEARESKGNKDADFERFKLNRIMTQMYGDDTQTGTQ